MFSAINSTPIVSATRSPNALVLHPGPMNRGSEITSEVADGPQSCVLEQVTNGIAVRMALLFLLISGAAEDGRDPASASASTSTEESQPPRNRRSTDKKEPPHASD